MSRRGYSDITFLHSTPPVYVAQACRNGVLYLIDADQAAGFRERMSLGNCLATQADKNPAKSVRRYGAPSHVDSDPDDEAECAERRDCFGTPRDRPSDHSGVVKLLEGLEYSDVRVVERGPPLVVEACHEERRYRFSFRTGRDLTGRSVIGDCGGDRHAARDYEQSARGGEVGCGALPKLAKSATVTFDRGSSSLSHEAKSFLLGIAEAAESCQAAVIEIAGYADAVGDRIKNLFLSQRRADAVAAFLIQNGIERHRLVARGYGQASDRDDLHEAQRRIELTISWLDK